MNYSSPFLINNGHIDTLFPYYFRKVKDIAYDRERIATPDDDFLDLDWLRKPEHKKLLIISHGLEGSSHRPYVYGMARYFHPRGYDILAWNCRACSGEINKSDIFYHSGASYDLKTVVEHVLKSHAYKEIYMVGFSLGGSLILKYLGEEGAGLPDVIRGNVVFSVPCDLRASTETLSRGFSRVYTKSFIKSFRSKFMQKKDRLEARGISFEGIDDIWDFKTFDDRFTAPLHGFKDAHDYWDRASAKHFIEGIRAPTLIVNAENDPFLHGECYPEKQCEANRKFVKLQIPRHGGHVGFAPLNTKGVFWSEAHALRYFEDLA